MKHIVKYCRMMASIDRKRQLFEGENTQMLKIGLENKLFSEIESGLPDGIVKERVLYLLKWYRKKAERYKFFTYIGTSASILLPAILALLNSEALCHYLPDDCVKSFQVILPILGSVGAAFYAFLQSKDNWIRYRTTVEQIKQKTVYYITQFETTNTVDPSVEKAFLKQIEDICASEIAEWRRNRTDATSELKGNYDPRDSQP